MVTFRQGLAPQTEFLQSRLSPRGYLGLHLTLGMMAIALGCWWFGGIVEDLLTNDPLVQIDHAARTQLGWRARLRTVG